MVDAVNTAENTKPRLNYWLRLFEALSFAGALYFILPALPNSCGTISLVPNGAYALGLFAVSRLLRDRGKPSFALAFELLIFAAFLFVFNDIANTMFAQACA